MTVEEAAPAASSLLRVPARAYEPLRLEIQYAGRLPRRLPAQDARSPKIARTTTIHSQPVTPRPPVFHRITYRSVVSGRKTTPRMGQMIGPKARSTHGVKIHISTTARRGESAAISKKMHHIPQVPFLGPAVARPSLSHGSGLRLRGKPANPHLAGAPGREILARPE